MSKAPTLWYPEINPDIPGVPVPALREAVRAAAITFCEKTQLWRFDLDDIDVVADTNDYTLTIDASLEAEIVVIDAVKYREDGEDEDKFQSLDPVSEVQEDKNRSGGWRALNTDASLEYYVSPVDKTTLTLVGTVNNSSTDGLRVTVVAKPLRTATALPDFLYDDHREDIGYGAKANLFMRRGMPWYEPQLAMSYETRFRAACGNGKFRRVRGMTNKDMMIKMRPLA